MAADADLTERIKAYAHEAGFDVVGVARAAPFPDDCRVTQERITAGHYSGLPWFTDERAAFSSDPRNLLPTARSIISLAMSYRPQGVPSAGGAGASVAGGVGTSGVTGGPRGRISAYAWGRDYHIVLKERMERVVAYIRAVSGPEQQARTLVDTARILDRAAARRAGVGWVGKHTNVITKAAGSWVFLGEILTELELIEDAPLRANCGSCDLCLRACPTGAIVAPYVVESNRCISYLTIEHRGIIPRELRPLMGAWIFGCDICQEVCPPNRRPGAPAHREFRPGATLLPMYNPTRSVVASFAAVPPEAAGVSPAPAIPSEAAGASPLAVQPARAGSTLSYKKHAAPDEKGVMPGATGDPSLATPELIPLLDISQEEFTRRFGKTPVKRAKREGLQRNVAIALGNSGDGVAVPALTRALREAVPVVRAHAAWALGRLGGPAAAQALHAARDRETDEMVREELVAALGALQNS